MKVSFVFFIITFATSAPALSQENKSQKLTANAIFLKSMAFHNPGNHWNAMRLSVHIQEPRLETPGRYSILDLNKKTGQFSLERNRDNHISRHLIDSLGNPRTLLDGQENIASELVEKYRLDPKSNFGFRRFYTLLYGLPMSLSDEGISLLDKVSEKKFGEYDVYAIEGELKTPMISKFWRLFISKTDYRLLGLELYTPDDATKGERIMLEDPIKIQEVMVPRIRHWYRIADNEYLGSDIIVKEIL